MANRDKSQGFGFLYGDLSTIVAQKNFQQANHSKTVNLNRDPIALRPLDENSNETNKDPIHQVKENLDRLQNLHHKLHAILNDLNHLSTKKKS